MIKIPVETATKIQIQLDKEERTFDQFINHVCYKYLIAVEREEQRSQNYVNFADLQLYYEESTDSEDIFKEKRIE